MLVIICEDWNVFARKTNVTEKNTFGLGWWIPEKLCRAVGVLRWYGAVFRLGSWHVASRLLPRWNLVIFRRDCREPCSLQTASGCHGEVNCRKIILPRHLKMSSVSKVALFSLKPQQIPDAHQSQTFTEQHCCYTLTDIVMFGPIAQMP